jgi:hypothetical protein
LIIFSIFSNCRLLCHRKTFEERGHPATAPARKSKEVIPGCATPALLRLESWVKFQILTRRRGDATFETGHRADAPLRSQLRRVGERACAIFSINIRNRKIAYVPSARQICRCSRIFNFTPVKFTPYALKFTPAVQYATCGVHPQ